MFPSVSQVPITGLPSRNRRLTGFGRMAGSGQRLTRSVERMNIPVEAGAVSPARLAADFSLRLPESLPMRLPIPPGVALLVLATAATTSGADPTYWQDVRPVLRKHCTVCHSQKNVKEPDVSGELALDSLDGIKTGGETPGANAGGGGGEPPGGGSPPPPAREENDPPRRPPAGCDPDAR